MMLSALIFMPIFFSLVIALVGNVVLSKRLAISFSFLYFLFSLLLFLFFDPSSEKLQMVEQASWFPAFGIQYFVGIDGISFWFVILTAFLLPICVGASWNLIQEKISVFYACLFLIISSVVGSFLALDAILFYVFFESSLIPLYFIIGIWGGEKRIYAAFKFFIYTAFGSLFLLVAIVTLMNLSALSLPQMSASVLDFYRLELPFSKTNVFNMQNILFFCFFLAFSIKLSLVPFHTWLPLAHVEAPAPGSALLAAVILKMGAYGFLRFILPIFPQSIAFFALPITLIAGLGILYGAVMALSQKNMKKLVAYSSISHMGYVLLGLFSLNFYGLTGSFYQMLTHAISSAGLFLLLGAIYERVHSLNISDYGGLAKKMPYLATFFILISLSVMAFPMTGGFISEFLVLMGAFSSHQVAGIILPIWGVVLSAVYMLYLIHRVFFGPVVNFSEKVSALSRREIFIFLPFVFLVFFMGVFPHFFLNYSLSSLNHLDENKMNYRLSVEKVRSLHEIQAEKKLSKADRVQTVQKENISSKTLPFGVIP